MESKFSKEEATIRDVLKWAEKHDHIQRHHAIVPIFRGEYGCFSNMYDCTVEYNGNVFQNAESAFQAQKDQTRIKDFTNLKGTEAKQLGKQVSLRSDWEQIRIKYMYEICLAKFKQNPVLRAKLIATEDALLVEGNWWGDTYWGVFKGNGKNYLGLTLMKVREDLRK